MANLRPSENNLYNRSQWPVSGEAGINADSITQAANQTGCRKFAAVRMEDAMKELEAGEFLPQPSQTTPAKACSLTRREMISLAALCDTFLPSIDAERLGPNKCSPSLRDFYATPASAVGTTEAVGEYLSSKLRHRRLWQLRVSLWFLSTWYGTLAMCGLKSLSGRFPFVRSFADVEAAQREEIMIMWSTSWIYLLRLLFRGLKAVIVLVYFTQLNEKNQNPTWKAIGYTGPDPNLGHQTDATSPARGDAKEERERRRRLDPLSDAIIHMSNLRPDATDLSRFGLSLTTPRREPRLPTIYCDAVVVGSGSGGGVVAGVLAMAGFKVVVLEKGGHHVSANLTLLEGQAMDRMYESHGLLASDDLSIYILAGSTVGGGSAVNWSASVRTPEHVIWEWRRRLGLELFGSEAFAEALDTVCGRMGVQCEVQGESLNNTVLRRGCSEMGYPVQTVARNAPPDHDCGWCCFGCRDGRKKGTNETWLVDLAQSGNGVILPGCRALRVLQRADPRKTRKVATGVLFEFEDSLTGKKQRCVVRSKVTVVACGSLNTPVLLKRSGLRNRHIGRHLHLHPVVMTWGYFPESGTRWQPSPERLEKTTSYEGAILTSMSTVVSNFATTGYGAVLQTPALHPGMFSVVTSWVSGADFKDRMARFARTTHIFALARDRGSGTVDAAGNVNYRISPEDEESLQRGLESVLRVMAAAGAEEVGTQHMAGERLNVRRASAQEVERFMRAAGRRALRDQKTPVFSAHQMGSCRMGVGPGESAVDPRGEAWEVEGLFVADASVLPTAVGVNPMVTVQAVAYCTAQFIVEVLTRKTRKGKVI